MGIFQINLKSSDSIYMDKNIKLNKLFLNYLIFKNETKYQNFIDHVKKPEHKKVSSEYFILYCQSCTVSLGKSKIHGFLLGLLFFFLATLAQ